VRRTLAQIFLGWTQAETEIAAQEGCSCAERNLDRLLQLFKRAHASWALSPALEQLGRLPNRFTTYCKARGYRRDEVNWTEKRSKARAIIWNVGKRERRLQLKQNSQRGAIRTEGWRIKGDGEEARKEAKAQGRDR
jgi:hypothetical protein